MTISNRGKPLYVYLQRPDNAQWVVVGRYRRDTAPDNGVLGAQGWYRYAPSYADGGLSWAIDPVNIPFLPELEHPALRYQGLHDVLRDACPDAWGQMLLKLKHNLPEDTPLVTYLVLAGNGDRWGALAVGNSARPGVAQLASPKLHKLEELVAELLAISQRGPTLNAQLRKHLFATPSLGGARPKATIQDGSSFWLVKPGLATDTVDLALLEHATQQWGRAAGLRFADTRHHALGNGRSVVRVLRFDRNGAQRLMALSGASLLQVQYPFVTAQDTAGASYPRLAEELKRIGVPAQDLEELFGRMIFNAVVGNDDDHPRNHAVIFDPAERRWRLSPAFDVVPNPDDIPDTLVMQVSVGRRDIRRESMLMDHARFGFSVREHAERYFDSMLVRIEQGFVHIQGLLSESLRDLMQQRMAITLPALRGHAKPARTIR